MWGGGVYFVLHWGTWTLCAHQSLTYLCAKKPFPTKRYFFSASTRLRGAANPDCGSGSGDSFIKFLENGFLDLTIEIKIVTIYKNFLSDHDFFSVKFLKSL
jgi:hypothetical protein